MALAFSFLLVASFMLISSPSFLANAAVENTWVTKATMNEARANFGFAAVNGKVYVFGGDQGYPTGNLVPEAVRMADTVNFTEEYNPTSDTWTFKKPMPTARALLGVAVYKDKIYCIGGYYGVKTPSDTLYFNVGANEVYDPRTDTWETRAPMPMFGFSASASVVDGKIYVLSSGSLQVYDPESDSWAMRASPPPWLSTFASAAIDDKIYALAELNVSNYVWPFIKNVIVYDTKKDYWMVGAELPYNSPHSVAIPMSATTGVNAAKLVYFFDEYGTHVYDPRSNSWKVGASMPSPRLLVGATTVSDKFYVIGGRSGEHDYITLLQPSAVNEEYTPFGYGTPDLLPVQVSLPPVTPDEAPPEIRIICPTNTTYNVTAGHTVEIPLIFESDGNLSWVGYSLDGGANVTASNGALIEIPVGSVCLTVYANDTAGNWAAPQTVYYSVAWNGGTPPPEPFPWLPVAAAAVVVAALISVTVVVYLKKHRR